MTDEFGLLTPPLLKEQRYRKDWERSVYSDASVTVSEFTRLPDFLREMPSSRTMFLYKDGM